MKKLCNICNKLKPLDQLTYNCIQKTHYSPCIPCRRYKARLRRKLNLEKCRAQDRKSKAKNKDAVRRRNKAWRQPNAGYRRNYESKYSHTPRGKIRLMYNAIQNRTRHVASYQHRELTFTRLEFIQWVESNYAHYMRLFTKWRLSNYNRRYSPSVDRVDNTKGYTLQNIQLVYQYQNAAKDNRG